MRLLPLGAVSFLLLLPLAAAQACGGRDNPYPAEHLSLDHSSYAGSGGLPFLSPGNDSRINLTFLMLDMARQQIDPAQAEMEEPSYSKLSSLFTIYDLDAACRRDAAKALAATEPSPAPAQGEGNRCLSFEAGKRAFVEAVQAEPTLTATERSLLVEARDKMPLSCDSKNASAPLSEDPFDRATKPTRTAQAFAAYLIAAKGFYDGAFDAALEQFQRLAKAENPWLRETARYMIARTLLNKAQIGAFTDFDGAAEPKVSDKDSLFAAELELNSYLAAYPAGRYLSSARGLMRRIYWLAGDKARLGAEYAKRIAQQQSATDIVDLANEIDQKFLSANGEGRDPGLLAVTDLMRMRGSGPKAPGLSAADLDAQASIFAGHEALYAYLRAARAYYVDKDPARALSLLGEPVTGALTPPYLAFSREALRGQALMGSGQFEAAAEQWRSLLSRASQAWQREAVELGLAMAWERAGTVNKVFLPETRISSPRIRAVLLRHVAGPILLRMAVADQHGAVGTESALFVLLFKEATRGQYAGFLRDYNAEAIGRETTALNWPGATAPYACPALKAVIAELAADAHSVHGLLCLGEFVRVSNLDAYERDRPAPDELGGSKSIFPGEPFSRGEIYKRLVADPATPDREKAYALFRLVNCYAPVNQNTCGGKDVDEKQRKAWYDELKSRYGATSWAKSLKYYW